MSFSCLKTRDIDLQLSDPELFFAFKQTALNQSIPMLRSNHLQPGINLNPISFPSADLTLKVFELQSHIHRAISFSYMEQMRNSQCFLMLWEHKSELCYSNMHINFKCFVFFRWNRHARRGRTPSPSLSRALLVEVLQVLSLPAALAHPAVSATVLLEGFPCLQCLWHQ